MKLLSTLSIFFLFLGGGTLWAQEDTTENRTELEVPTNPDAEADVAADTPATRSGSRAGVEKIEVTGSHIKRIDIEGPSPVLTLDREYLDRSGYNSVADVLRDSTITAQGVAREDSGTATSGSATAGLRGFGPDKILVLLNGTRLPKIGGGNSVDLNLIPFQAIERVEILKDGASATYGSDALAGVINFITKKDFDGMSFTTRYSMADATGGDRQDLAAVYGKNTSKGNFLAIYQYRKNEEILDKDRAWSTPAVSSLGSPGSYQTVNPGDGATGNFQPDPNCPAGRLAPNGPNTFCGFDFSPYSWMQPSMEQHSAVLSGNVDFTESFGMYGTATYTNRLSHWQYAPAPDIFKDDTATGAAQSYQVPNATNGLPGWGLPGVGANDLNVAYRLVEELGPRANRDTTDSYGGTIGARGYLSDTWEWDQSLTYGTSEVYSLGHAGYADKDVLFALMNDGTWTPFGLTKGDVSASQVPSEQVINSSLIMTQFKATGEVGQLGGGLITAAVGASAAWEDYEERVDAVTQRGALFGGAGSAGSASRNFQAIFTELGYTISDFEFQLAGRLDRFNDFGETFNPKFGMRYKPTNSVMFRGSVGTGFKAPTLNELYAAQGYGFPTYTDQTACAAAGGPESGDPVCRPQQYRTLTGGNPGLQEETSFSYNFGTVIQPNKDFNITLDYWFTAIDGAISVDLDNIMLAERSLGAAGLAQYGVIVNRFSNGLLDDVIAPNLNLAKQQADGLELETQYSIHLGSLTIVPQMSHTHLLSYQEEPFPGLGLQSRLGENGRPRWRNSFSTSFNFGSHSIRGTGRTVAGQYKQAHTADRSDERKLATYTEYDLNYLFKAGWGGTINFGIKNLLDSDRPLDDTAGFADRLNGSLYDQIGRLYYLGYSHDF